MAVGSNVNPNYPIPGIDQSSKGFRDNFSATKVEIEYLQGKNIVLIGDATGSALIDGGPGDVVISTLVSVANVAAGGADRTVQFNDAGTLAGQATLTWNVDETLVIGNQMPDTYYWLDSGRAKIHDSLLLQGDSQPAALTIASTDPTYAGVILGVYNNSGVGMANLNVVNVDAVTVDTLNIQFNGTNAAQFNLNGLAVGAVYEAAPGGPLGYLEVYADGQPDIANFYTTFGNSDNGVRIQTANANSTAGVVLQQTAADSVVGIRIGQTGNFTIHTGLNAGANLDDSSQVVTIDPAGQMGVGITDPSFRVDVDGGIQWNAAKSANVTVYSVDIIGVAVDSWDSSIYRSADYTVQVTSATGAIEITKLLVMQEMGSVYQYIYANLNSAGGGLGPPTLGTILSAQDGSQIQLIYEGVSPGNLVKVDATYITL